MLVFILIDMYRKTKRQRNSEINDEGGNDKKDEDLIMSFHGLLRGVNSSGNDSIGEYFQCTYYGNCEFFSGSNYCQTGFSDCFRIHQNLNFLKRS